MTVNVLRDAARNCVRIFSFLVAEYGFRAPTVSSDSASFTVRFQTDVTGVEVNYAIRGGLIVWICQLTGGSWPGRPGRITDESAIRWFDLYDVQAVVEGHPPVADDLIYAIPSDEILQARAESLRTDGDSLLRGDFTLVPQLRARVIARATRA